MRLTALLIIGFLLPGSALASPCQAFVGTWPGQIYAQLGDSVARAAPVDISYVGHSTFRIETPAGVAIATDYFGASGGDTPDVVTMNHAHETHFTDYPDPAIPHVLRGWKTGGRAEHYLEVEDVLIRNVPTDLRSFGFEADGNSIFIFEIGALCIGHLGHLHHEPSEAHYAAIGRLDVVMAPVDGTYTLNIGQMIKILKRMKARIVLPMHAFGPSGLARFLNGMSDAFAIRHERSGRISISPETLPAEPTVIVLPARLAAPLDE